MSRLSMGQPGVAMRHSGTIFVGLFL